MACLREEINIQHYHLKAQTCWQSHQFSSCVCQILSASKCLSCLCQNILSKRDTTEIIQLSIKRDQTQWAPAAVANIKVSSCQCVKSLPNIDFDHQMALAHFHSFANNSYSPTTPTLTARLFSHIHLVTFYLIKKLPKIAFNRLLYLVCTKQHGGCVCLMYQWY